MYIHMRTAMQGYAASTTTVNARETAAIAPLVAKVAATSYPTARPGGEARRGRTRVADQLGADDRILGVAPDRLRLMTKIARLYHEQGLRQPQIAERLHISQPRVSRLLKQAVEMGVVRTTVISPRDVHADLEDVLEAGYGLTEVVVADVEEGADELEITRAIGAAAAVYLEATLTRGERIGVSSWSSTLLAAVEAMRPNVVPPAEKVVQVLGGVGTVTAQSQATRITGRLAQVVGATGVYLPAPGLLASPDMRQMFMTDPTIAPVLTEWRRLTTALVGIGSVEPSPLLRESGNAIAASEVASLRRKKAVGDVCLRFFDKHGKHIDSELDNRVVGIDAPTLLAVPRKVALAGGARKFTAIKAALRGGWVDVLITDLQMAKQLAAELPARR
jgi:DNA-binding transcriptional regulator LsrR (DeoR family)